MTKGLKSKKLDDAKMFNWETVYRQLENVKAIVETGFKPTQEQKNQILRDRAKSLAKEPEVKNEEENFVEVVEFILAYETYGIESSYVRELFPLKELTSLPGTPPFILGLTNVRGKILPVIDIKRFFDLPTIGLTDLNKLIILNSRNVEFGILADAIKGIRFLSLDTLQPALATLTGIRAEYLKGVTNDRVVILDAAKLLNDKSISMQEGK